MQQRSLLDAVHGQNPSETFKSFRKIILPIFYLFVQILVTTQMWKISFGLYWTISSSWRPTFAICHRAEKSADTLLIMEVYTMKEKG